MADVRAVTTAAIAATALLVGALAVGLAPRSSSATSTIPVNLLSPEADFATPLRAAGTPAAQLVTSPTAPLLPGGEAALRRVLRSAGTRSDERVSVSDSATEPTFGFDKPPQRRLQVLARTEDPERARRLAGAVATGYSRSRRRFFEGRMRAVAAVRSATPARRRKGASPRLNAATVVALRELDRLGEASPGVSVDRDATPSPLRAGAVSGLVALIALRLVPRRRRR